MVTQLGFAVGTHYCMGTAVESKVMLGHAHMDCGMVGMDKDCEFNPSCDTDIINSACCKDSYLSIGIGNDYMPITELTVLQLNFVSASFLKYSTPLTIIREYLSYPNYDPPSVIQDLLLIHQVFII